MASMRPAKVVFGDAQNMGSDVKLAEGQISEGSSEHHNNGMGGGASGVPPKSILKSRNASLSADSVQSVSGASSALSVHGVEAEDFGVQQKLKRKRAKKIYVPSRSTKFDEFGQFDVFDFIQYKTQMKIFEATERGQSLHRRNTFVSGERLMGNVYELTGASISSKHKAKRRADSGAFVVSSVTSKFATPMKPKKKLKKSETPARMVLQGAIAVEEYDSFKADIAGIKSEKLVRAAFKAHVLVKEFLARCPDIPFDKHGGKRKRALPTTLKVTKKPLMNSGLGTSPIRELEGQSSDLKREEAQNTEEPLENDSTSTAGTRAPASSGVDHITAINSWLQKNYSNLTAGQKQLVHMQLQYLDNLKRTAAFQNSAFQLSPQQLSNLNNMAFLSAHYNTGIPQQPQMQIHNSPPRQQVLNVGVPMFQNQHQIFHVLQQQQAMQMAYPVSFAVSGASSQMQNVQSPNHPQMLNLRHAQTPPQNQNNSPGQDAHGNGLQ